MKPCGMSANSFSIDRPRERSLSEIMSFPIVLLQEASGHAQVHSNVRVRHAQHMLIAKGASTGTSECDAPADPVLVDNFDFEHIGRDVRDEDRAFFVPLRLRAAVVVRRCLERRRRRGFAIRDEVHGAERVLDTDFLRLLEVARREHGEVQHAVVAEHWGRRANAAAPERALSRRASTVHAHNGKAVVWRECGGCAFVSTIAALSFEVLFELSGPSRRPRTHRREKRGAMRLDLSILDGPRFSHYRKNQKEKAKPLGVTVSNFLGEFPPCESSAFVAVCDSHDQVHLTAKRLTAWLGELLMVVKTYRMLNMPKVKTKLAVIALRCERARSNKAVVLDSTCATAHIGKKQRHETRRGSSF